MIAITMEDLYPQESWNFVFGEADSLHHVGVFSFARYSEAFYSRKPDASLSLSPQHYSLLLRRSCRVMVHEVHSLSFLFPITVHITHTFFAYFLDHSFVQYWGFLSLSFF